MATGPQSPKLVDPRELARAGRAWQSVVPIANFKRLAKLVGNDAASVEVDLRFELDDQGRCRVDGAVRLNATLRCQRCLRFVERRVDTDIDLLVLRSESDARALTPAYDTYVLAEPETSIEALVEDDMLLSLPHQVCDRPDDCPHTPRLEYPSDKAADQPAARPFAVLARLRRKNE